MSEIVLETAPGDVRFPGMNQNHRCWVNFNEYLVCMKTNDDDESACAKRIQAYRSICPAEWVDNWKDQIGNGTFAGVTFDSKEEH
jgi:cytochrome c oxidase subunit 6b